MHPSHSKAGRTRRPGAELNVPLRENTQVGPRIRRTAERILRVPVTREGEGGRPASASRALVILAGPAMARSLRSSAQATVKRMVPGLDEGHTLQIAVVDELAQVGTPDRAAVGHDGGVFPAAVLVAGV